MSWSNPALNASPAPTSSSPATVDAAAPTSIAWGQKLSGPKSTPSESSGNAAAAVIAWTADAPSIITALVAEATPPLTPYAAELAILSTRADRTGSISTISANCDSEASGSSINSNSRVAVDGRIGSLRASSSQSAEASLPTVGDISHRPLCN